MTDWVWASAPPARSIPELLVALGCVAPECERCWPDGVYDTLFRLRFEAGSPPVHTVGREGFARDVEGYHRYDCAGAERLAHTRCQLPNRTWVGVPWTPT